MEHVLRILRRRLPLVALCVLVVCAAAFGLSKHATKKYTAVASIAFQSNPLSQQIAGLSSGNLSGSGLLAQHASEIEDVRLGDTAAKTARLLAHGLTAEKVVKATSIAGQGESGVVTVSATSTSPALAAAIANTYVKQFVAEQRGATHRYFTSALALVKKQLAVLSPRQRASQDGFALTTRAQTLQLLSELNAGNVEVAQEASPPTSPSSPKTSRNVVLGLLLGGLLGLGLAFLLESLDRRVKGPEELEAVYQRPLLGVIPPSSAIARTPLPAAEQEAFNLIRGHLRLLNGDRDLSTIMVASPASGDGKTTVARHLAEAAARLGSRVLLIEADLRNPTLAEQLGASPGPGLAGVLARIASLDEEIRSIDLRASSTDASRKRTLDLLPAGGALPLNPAELLEGEAMAAVLERARSSYELVVIDTAPVGTVSDALPLLRKVDGVIVVSRIGQSRKDAAERFHRVLLDSGVHVVGIVANAAKQSGHRPYSAASYDSTRLVASTNGATPDEHTIPVGPV